MTEPREPDNLADMERAASAMAEQIRHLARITRSLASLTDAIEELRSAAGGLAPADQPRQVEPAEPSAPEPAAPPAGDAQSGNHRTAPAAPEAENRGPEPSSALGRPEPVSVTVSCPDGSLDLVRVFRALQPMDGVADLNLLSYGGGRAVLQLIVYKPPHEIDLSDALTTAFPEGITGDWIAPTEYVAVIAGSQRT